MSNFVTVDFIFFILLLVLALDVFGYSSIA